MAAIKLVNFIALLTFAVLAVSFNATPVSAVTVQQGAHHARGHAAHHAIAKKRQNSSGRRCKQRPTSLAASSTPAPAPATSSKAPAPVSSSKAAEPSPDKDPQPASTSKASTSPAPSPTPASSGGGGNGKKAGIAWNNQDTQSLRNWEAAGAIYNWSPYVDPLYKELGFDTMSMLWGWKQADQFAKLTATPGYANWAMGPNEPNESSQSNMSPADAAKLWRQYIQPLKAKGYKLVGPACTSAPDAIQWQKDFMAACSDCSFDSLALHYYGTSAQDFIGYVQSFHDAFPQYQIMVTEFACQNFGGGAQASQDQVNSFMSTVKGWMDGQWFIKYYFAFGVLHDMYNVNYANQLLGGDGKPTALGNKYLYG